MEREELLALLRGNEWDDVEAKESANGVSKSAYTTVSAFANTKGGWLLFGVAEEKKGLVVKGVSDPDRIQNDFLTACRTTEKFSRPVTVHPHQHELEEKVVLAFYVEPSRRFDKPIRVRDGKGGWTAYIRLGAGDHRCNAEEEGRFLRDASTEPFDGALFCSYAEDTLEPESLRWFRGLYASRHEAQPLTELSDPLFLEELGLLRDGQLTHAAALLFGKQKLIARLKPAGLVDFRLIRQPWSEEAPAHRFDDRLLCEGNLIQALRALIERLLGLVPNPFSLEADTLQRPAHPPEYRALREALVNLLVHQDYSDKHRLAKILWYDDRTCFTNPGDSFVSVEDMLGGGSSDLRNPLLARLLRQIGFAEQAGSGLPTIVRTWREVERQPPEVVSELDTHFNETFHLVQPGNFAAWRQLLGVGPEENLWKRHDQVVCTLDSVKPMEARRGWSTEQVARYNRERFDDLINAGWDLVVIDEAHRLGGSTETVARFRLGEGLAQASPYLLLLSATPHQGKTDAFRRLLGFLDPDALPDDSSVTRENVAPYVIRTEKRRAINDKGEPLFQPRHTQIVSVAWDSARLEQRVLYDAVTEYVREGYNQALRDKQPAVGFLMILMQRLVTSSTAAIRTALERRLQVLELPTGQLTLFGEDVGEDWAELEGQEQLETLLNSRLKELKNERAEVELLLSAARRCEARGLDAKAQALLDTIGQLQREENDPALKVLLFTEFVPTQTMLAEVLEQRGYPVVLLNGSMNLEERKSAQRAFANEAQILISTDAGGEGLNLQFCHVIINYDLPWNPMKLEQRIGRVDRIGQTHVVRALNFALEDTVELRVREVLEEKLERILQEFGVDKLSDVLDSEENGLDFQQLYVNAVLTPEEAAARAAALAEAIRARALSAHDGASLLSSTEELDPQAAQRVAGHLMPFWTERMTLAWLQTQAEAGGQVRPNPAGGLDLHWPDGHRDLRATFSRQSAKEAGLLHLSLEEPRLRALTAALPPRAPGMTVPVLHLPELAGKVSGTWSLWRVAVQTSEGRSQRMLPLFLSSESRLLEPTARLIWERLISLEGELQLLAESQLLPADAAEAYDRSHQQAQQQGKPLFDELQAKHQQKLERERRKQELAFSARQRAIEQLGLPQVRDFRRAQLQQEEQQWRQEFQRRQETLPSLTLLQLVSLAPASA